MFVNRHYEALDAHYAVEEDDSYGDLVAPNGNDAAPFHRWFHLKEAFSASLTERVLSDLGLSRKDSVRLLDPFAGVGTAVVSAMEDRRVSASYGIERNPFLAHVAEAKVAALKAGRNAYGCLEAFAEDVVAACRRQEVPQAPVPALSSFSNTAYFPAPVLRELLRLKAAVDGLGAPEPLRDLARVALAASLEPVSALRRDGRTLRYVPRKRTAGVHEEFTRRLAEIGADIEQSRGASRGRIVLGDGRTPQLAFPRLRPTVVLFSPPYPNNIDYTEVYKLEAWFLGLIESQAAFRAQRLRTLRSHPSILFAQDYPASSNGYRKDIAELLDPLLLSIPSGRYALARERLVRGYFEDLLQVLSNASKMQRSGDRLVYVVANSAHGTKDKPLIIAADVLIARIAEMVGYRVDRLAVARRPARRRVPTPHLRETVGFLTRA